MIHIEFEKSVRKSAFVTGRKPDGASSESESEAEDGAGKSPGKKVKIFLIERFAFFHYELWVELLKCFHPCVGRVISGVFCRTRHSCLPKNNTERISV